MAALVSHRICETAGSLMPDTSSPSSPLAKKLRILPGNSVRVLHAPEGFLATLEPLPDGAFIAQRDLLCDVTLAFARDSTQLAAVLEDAIAFTRAGGVLWFIFPKKSGGLASDLGRDEVAAQVSRASGWGPVTNVALDETWSALRFKPEASIARGQR
jgi:hypothetical protein